MSRLLLRSFFLFSAILSLLFGCSGSQHENEATRNLSREDKIRYEQYMVQGQALYDAHCSNCHQEDGSGLRRLIPPLANSDYMRQNIERTVCIIKHGMEGQIMVNGHDYHQKMPGNKELKDIEIAEIATFIYNSWGNQKGYIGVQEVSSYLKSCK